MLQLKNLDAKTLLRVETLLVVLVLVVGVVGYQQSQRAGKLRDAGSALDRQLRNAKNTLGDLQASTDEDALKQQLDKANADKAAVQQQLERLQAAPEIGSFPSYQRVLDLGTTIIASAAEQQLRPREFDIGSTTFSVGGVQYSAVSYTIEAQGTKDALLSMLRLVGDFPTAVVQGLGFTRDPNSADQWSISLDLIVIYQ